MALSRPISAAGTWVLLWKQPLELCWAVCALNEKSHRALQHEDAGQCPRLKCFASVTVAAWPWSCWNPELKVPSSAWGFSAHSWVPPSLVLLCLCGPARLRPTVSTLKMSSLVQLLCTESPQPCMPCRVGHWDCGSMLSPPLASSALPMPFTAAQGPQELSLLS